MANRSNIMSKKEFANYFKLTRIKRKYGRQSYFTQQRDGWLFHIKIPTEGNSVKTVQQIQTGTSSYTKAINKVYAMAEACEENVEKYAKRRTDVRYDPGYGQV